MFAGYVIQRLLGAGGMGEVYLARHPRLPRLDAVKILRADLTDDADYRQRFHREADLAATLSHPRIVGVYDRGEFNGRLWISMDYVEGTDAGRLVKDNYPAGMPERDVRDIVTAVAEALDFAHRRRLLHRDVKPANILLTEPDDDERRVLLADFGIARQVDDISGLTAMNMTVGSVAYAAPEQLMGEDIDGRADEYALAATAFTLLSGAPPFPQTNPAVVIGKHLNTPAPSLAGHRPELAHLDAALSKALAKDPNDRYPRCLDFARALGQQDSATPVPDAGTAAAPTQYLNVPATPVSAAQPSRQRAAPSPPPPPASPPPPPASVSSVDPVAPYGRDPATGQPLSDKSVVIAGLLQLFLGMFGAGRFYIGSTRIAVVQAFITVLGFIPGAQFLIGVVVIWAFIDAIRIFRGSVTDGYGRKLRKHT